MINTLCEAVKNAHAWKPEEKNSMRRLFEHALKVWPNLVTCLRETQGQLVYNASQRSFNFKTIAEFDLELVKLADAGKLDEALLLTADKLIASVKEFWPDCPLESYRLLLTQRLERPSGSSTPATVCPQGP